MCRWDIWTKKGKSGRGVSPPKLGILCHGFELLGFGRKKNVSSIQMNKVLEEQGGLGGSMWKRRHFPGSPDGSGGGREEA